VYLRITSTFPPHFKGLHLDAHLIERCLLPGESWSNGYNVIIKQCHYIKIPICVELISYLTSYGAKERSSAVSARAVSLILQMSLIPRSTSLFSASSVVLNIAMVSEFVHNSNSVTVILFQHASELSSPSPKQLLIVLQTNPHGTPRLS
jgi:hypothetical protein